MKAAQNGATPQAAATVGVRGAVDALEQSLAGLEEVANVTPAAFQEIAEQMQVLHARLRAQEAANYLGDPLKKFQARAPHLAETAERLRRELTTMIGELDRLMRVADSITDQPLEEQEIFMLRVKELLATKRRHAAEEDRIVDYSLWQDVGGNG